MHRCIHTGTQNQWINASMAMMLVDQKASRPYLDRMADLLDSIRGAIEQAETSGVTRYRIALDTGISQALLSRFMSGERGLSVESIERLAEYLGLEIIVRPKRKGRK